MSQPQSNSFSASNHQQYQYSSYTNTQQEHGSNVGMPRAQPLPQPRLRNLPADVRLPPSLNNAQQQDQYNRPPPRSVHQVPPSMSNSNYPVSYTNAAPLPTNSAGEKVTVPVAEINSFLDELQEENMHLKEVLSMNNSIISRKLADLERQGEELKCLSDENSVLKSQLSTSTNQFFEARVAVLGFKCRVMQLQAQGDTNQKHILPPQQLGPHEINAQIGTLTQEKRKLLDENRSLEEVITVERDKLRRMEDKKRIAEEERLRLQSRVDQLDNEMKIMENRLGEAQDHSYQEHSSRTRMSQNLKTMETDKRRLSEQVGQLRATNTTLQSQVDSLKTTEKKLSERIHQLESEKAQSSPQPPVPKPRTNVHNPQVAQLQAEIERLQGELVSTREKVTKENQTRSNVESSLSKKTVEYQELLLKYNEATSDKQQRSTEEVQRLSDELSALKLSREGSLREKESAIDRVTKEKSELQTRLASLEKQKQDEIAALHREQDRVLRKQKGDHEGIVANLEEKLRLASAQQTLVGAKSSGSTSAIARKLNDALGKVKELETKLASQTSAYEEDQKRWEEEREQLQAESGESLDHIVERLEHFENRTKQLEEVEASLTATRTTLQRNLHQTQQDLTHKTDVERSLTQQLAQAETQLRDKSQEADLLRGQLDSERQDKEKRTKKMDMLMSQCNEAKDTEQRMKDRHREFDTQRRKLEEEKRELSLTVQQLMEARNRQDGEKHSMEGAVGELKRELSTIMQDYQTVVDSNSQAQADLERMSLHNQQLQAELEEKSTRVRQVEGQRNGIQDRLKHMDAQLKMYQEDFERERQAREAAVKVKNLVEERMAKKEKEVKELRERINQQAMQTLSTDDQYEEASDTNQGPLSTYNRPPSRRLNPPPQDTHSLSPSPGRSGEQLRIHQGDYQEPRGQLSGPQQRYSHEHEPPPPLPPKPPAQQQQHASYNPGPSQGGHFQGGSQGGHLQGGQFGGQFPDHSRTQQFPPHTSGQTPPQRVARPVTTNQEPGTAGSGDMARMGGYQSQLTMPPGGYSQGGFPPHQPVDSGPSQWRHESRRNDLSNTPRNNFSGPQSRNNLDMPQPGGMTHPPVSQSGLSMAVPGQSMQGGYGMQGEPWLAPGEVVNKAPPSMACPICGLQDFRTQTDLELHCAQCT